MSKHVDMCEECYYYCEEEERCMTDERESGMPMKCQVDDGDLSLCIRILGIVDLLVLLLILVFLSKIL